MVVLGGTLVLGMRERGARVSVTGGGGGAALPLLGDWKWSTAGRGNGKKWRVAVALMSTALWAGWLGIMFFLAFR